MNKFKTGDIVRPVCLKSRHQAPFNDPLRWKGKIRKIYDEGAVLVDWINGSAFWKGCMSAYDPNDLVLLSTKKKRSKKTRVNALYMASVLDGATHKGLVSVINSKGAKSFGATPTQAISRYEDNHGGMIPKDQILVWKLEPHSVRKQPNGKFRLNRKVVTK